MEDEAKHAAGIIVNRFKEGTLPYQMTVLSTACNCLVLSTTDLAGMPYTVLVNTTDEISMKRDIEKLFAAGYRFSAQDAKVTSSYHQDLLRRARSILIDQGRSGNPSPSDVMQAILHTGTALNAQLDEDTRSKGLEGIIEKLRAVGLESSDLPLSEKYQDLNRFYNATKHKSRPATERSRARLEGPEGWQIAMDYFECARRVFLWYYAEKSAVPTWHELEPIDCGQLAKKYVFDIAKRW